MGCLGVPRASERLLLEVPQPRRRRVERRGDRRDGPPLVQHDLEEARRDQLVQVSGAVVVDAERHAAGGERLRLPAARRPAALSVQSGHNRPQIPEQEQNQDAAKHTLVCAGRVQK